jgi:hypothetical protein
MIGKSRHSKVVIQAVEHDPHARVRAGSRHIAGIGTGLAPSTFGLAIRGQVDQRAA